MSFEQLSNYHQPRLEAARHHLLDGETSVACLPKAATARLQEIWPQPLFFSSFLHARLDPLPQFTVGSALFHALGEAVGDQVEQHHVIWETHPRGMRTVDIAYPTPEGYQSVALSPDLPNLTQWKPVHSVREVFQLFCPTNWHRVEETVQPGYEKVGIPSPQTSSALAELQGIYDRVITNASLRTLTDLAMGISGSLEQRLFRDHSSQLAVPEAYTQSRLKGRINNTLTVLDEAVGIENVLAGAVDERTAANIFVGGTGEKLIRVGFSTKRKRFQVSEFEAHQPWVKLTDRKTISKEDVFELVQNGEVIAAGVPAFVALLTASSVVPVAHLGNEHGTAETVLSALKNTAGFENSRGYLQVVEDNRDAWPIVKVRSANPEAPVRVSLSTLFLWQALDMIDPDQVLTKSLRLGRPEEVESL